MAKIPPKAAASKPGKDTVYIDVDDEITAIIDKVESANQKIVALVLPKRMATLQSIVNMRLLKRSATTAGKNVVLITSEHALLPLAGVAGLHVAKNLQSKPEIPAGPHAGAAAAESEAEEASVDENDQQELEDQPQKLDYNQPIGALATAHEEPEEISLDDEDGKAAGAAAAATEVPKKAHKSKSPKVPNFDKFRWLLFGGIAAVIALIIFIILASTVLPHSTITVTTSSTPVSLDTNLTASGSAQALDATKKIIPSVLKTSDQTANQQVNATGQQNNGEKATGTANLKNCSDAPVTLPAGTGIGSNGVNFITQRSVTLNSGNFDSHDNCKNTGDHIGSVGVTAQSPGTKYNVNGQSFSTSGGVTGSVTASGGTDNNVTILTQSDVDGAKSKVSSSDSDKFAKDFESDLSNQGYYVLTSTIKAGDPVFTSTPAVGQAASTASVNVKITYSVLAVKRTDLQTFVSDALGKQIDSSKEKLSDSNVLNNLNIDVQNQTQANATLALTKTSTAVPILNEQAIKDNAAGKKENDIRTYINTYPGVKNVEVKFSPFWVSHAPKNASKIKIVQKQLTGS